jgi:hypothetical protein
MNHALSVKQAKLPSYNLYYSPSLLLLPQLLRVLHGAPVLVPGRGGREPGSQGGGGGGVLSAAPAQHSELPTLHELSQRNDGFAGRDVPLNHQVRNIFFNKTIDHSARNVGRVRAAHTAGRAPGCHLLAHMAAQHRLQVCLQRGGGRAAAQLSLGAASPGPALLRAAALVDHLHDGGELVGSEEVAGAEEGGVLEQARVAGKHRTHI